MNSTIVEFFGLALTTLLAAVFVGYMVDVINIQHKFEQNVQNAQVVRMQAQVRADENKFNNTEVLYTDVISLILRSRNSDMTITVLPNSGSHGGVWSPTFQQTAYDMMPIANRLTQTSIYFIELTRGLNNELTGYRITRR